MKLSSELFIKSIIRNVAIKAAVYQVESDFISKDLYRSFKPKSLSG